MKQETIVRLKIISKDHTPQNISETVGLQCDESWHRGETRKHTIIIEDDNGWVIHSGLARAASLDEHLDALWKKVEPVKAQIHRLSSRDTVEWSCVVYSTAMPALDFGPAIISRLAELGAGLDIDLYVLPES